MALYALYRMTQRATTPPEDTESYLGVLPPPRRCGRGRRGLAAEQAEQAEADREQEQEQEQDTQP